ncbi:MAG: haloalkane dehalogenase, partial [Spirosomataceae bacterium]
SISDMPFSLKIALKMIRNPIFGKLMVLRANIFIKKMLPDTILQKLNKDEKDYYAAAYPDAKSRKPLLAWPMDVPFKDGKPTSATAAIKSWAKWLPKSDIPKLCFYVSPGVIMKQKDIEVIKNTFKSKEIIYLGPGLHFIQEDYPHEIGNEISKWYDKIK